MKREELLKSLAWEYFDTLLNRRDSTVCDRLLSGDYRDSDAPEAAPGPVEPRTYVTAFLEEYPDLELKIEDIFAEGDRVAMRNVWTGTSRRTGRRLQRMGIVILAFDHQDRITRRWSAYRDQGE